MDEKALKKLRDEIRLVLAGQGEYGLNVEQIAQRVFPDEEYDRALKDRIRALLKNDPFIEHYGKTRGRYFRIAGVTFAENLSINEVKDAVYVCFELSYQGIDGWNESGSFRGNDFWLNLKKHFPAIHDSIYNEYTGNTNDEFIDSKWDEITGDLILPKLQGHELEPNFEIDYRTYHWVRNPDWMKKKKITVEIPNSIDIILDEIKILLKAAVANLDYEIEGVDKSLEVEENNPIWEILDYAMHFGYLEDKLTRGQVINFALLHFYRTLKSDENIELPNGYE